MSQAPSSAPSVPLRLRVAVILQMLIAAIMFSYYGFRRGYQFGDSNVQTASALALWAVWWAVAAQTKNPQFVRRTLKLSLLLVLPATLNSMYRATRATEFLFALVVALAGLLSAGGYALAFPKQPSR